MLLDKLYTYSGCPVATYASICSGDAFPKCTVVDSVNFVTWSPYLMTTPVYTSWDLPTSLNVHVKQLLVVL